MIQGNWWIPGNEEKKLPGTLSFARNEIHLELTGQLLDSPLGQLSRADEIHGITSGSREAKDVEKDVVGKRIVLQNCLEVNRNSNGLHATSSTFSATVAYVTQNVRDIKYFSLKFHEVRVTFSHLPDFAITEGRLVKFDRKSGERKHDRGLTASYSYQALPTAKINGKTLEFYQSVRQSGDLIRRAVIEPRVSLKICSEEAVSLQEWYGEFITPLRHFLTLATTQTNRVMNIEAFHSNNVEFNIITRETLQFGSVDFSEALFGLFALRDIEEFGTVMVKWFRLYEDHGTRMVQNLLFGSLSNSNVGDRFLNLARALEVYHRAKFSDKVMPTKEFKAKREEILEKVNEAHREWLKEKLAENIANKQTLNQQLQSLFKNLAALDLAETLGISEELIARRIKDIRNNLTHVSKKSKNIRPKEILWLSYLMEYLLQALLLKEIGFPVEQVKREQQYSFRMEQIAEALSHLQEPEK